jgi:hypothetical protein
LKMLVYHIYQFKIKQLECKLIKTKQSFNKSPNTHENLHYQKPESFSESNDTNYFHNSQLEINRKSIHEINNANQNVMSTDDLCSQHNKHSNNNCNHEDPSQSSNIYINLSYWPEHFNFF